MAKKIDPQKKLLITAIKKTINKNTVLPILESVLLNGKEAIVSDLETSVIIPFESDINAAIPSDKFLDCLEMFEKPGFKSVRVETPIPIPEHFIVEGKIYDGNEQEAKESYQHYLNNFTDNADDAQKWPEWLEEHQTNLEASEIEPKPPLVSEHIEIAEGKRVIKLQGDSADNFPRIPLTDKDYPVIGSLSEADMGKLANALSFVSSDDLRPAMTGVYFGEKEMDKKSRIVATDAHRMYFDELDEPMKRKFILPAKAAKILLALGGEWVVTTNEEYELDKDGNVLLKRPMVKEQREVPYFEVDGIRFRGVEAEERQNYEDSFRRDSMSFVEWLEFKDMMIEDGEMEWVEVPDMTKDPVAELLDITNVCFTREDGVKVITRVIDARYPDYKVVIPQDEPNTVVTVNPDELLQELKNASKFANRSTNQVIFGANGKLSIAAQDIDFSFEYKNELEQAEIRHNAGEGFAIAFNGKFLSEIVTKEKDQPTVMKLWAPTKCAILNEHYLVMPLMINSDN